MKLVRTQFVTFFLTLAASAAGAEEKPGVPQMDVTWFKNQLFWLGISFFLLYIIVSKLIVPSVGGVLEIRRRTIAEAIEKAESFKKTAAAARGDSEAQTHEVHDQVNAMLTKARTETAARAQQAMAKLASDLETKSHQAILEIDRAIASAKPAMQAASAEVATAMAEKLLGQKIDADTVTKAIKAA